LLWIGGAACDLWLWCVRAALAELTPIGVFIALAFLSWSYDSRLMGRAVLIFFGASLVVRALLPPSPARNGSASSGSQD
jgi:hypothetical protein